jgi:hypothetical protein
LARAQSIEDLERRLGEQTRWLLGVLVALLIPIIGMWFRG